MVTLEICEGNPGALSFLMLAFKIEPAKSEVAFYRMQANGICGDRLYMLWNDCCERDIEKTLKIMCDKPIKEIIEHINYEKGRGIPF